MKTPFRHQVTEWDCVPTTFVNALCYLFERDKIPPLVIQRIHMYCLDLVESRGRIGNGTSGSAVNLLGNWLDAYVDSRKIRKSKDSKSMVPRFQVSAEYLEGKSVHLRQGNKIAACFNRRGVALLSVTHGKGSRHYILALGIEDGWVHCFDPYPMQNRNRHLRNFEYIQPDGLHAPNLRIRVDWLEARPNKQQKFRFGLQDERECLLLKRR